MATPEWEIDKQDFLKRLGCSEGEFQKHLRLPDIKSIKRIIPLRHLERVESIAAMRKEMLVCFISRMTTLNAKRPFRNTGAENIEIRKIDPNQLKIGQRFVYRENYQNLLENLPNLFGKWVISTGLSDLGAYFAFGSDRDGMESLACYIPPIVEQHGPDLVIMDGIHRNYITKQLGATMNAIIVRNVSVPFPCGIKSWKNIKVISLADKPKNINDRYFSLNKGLFRDLKHLGIDG